MTPDNSEHDSNVLSYTLQMEIFHNWKMNKQSFNNPHHRQALNDNNMHLR